MSKRRFAKLEVGFRIRHPTGQLLSEFWFGTADGEGWAASYWLDGKPEKVSSLTLEQFEDGLRSVMEPR